MITSRDKEKKPGQLIKELDTLVSLFVRLNAADEHGTVKCISCNTKMFWSDADCCHFKDRSNMATRYYIPNLAPGCQECNRHNHYEHIQRWGLKIGEKILGELNRKSHSLMKFTRAELQEMIEDYKLKVAELRRTKHL